MILGCTHYPLFENIIKKYLPSTEIINTGKVIADYLDEKYQVQDNNESDEFYLTDIQCNFLEVADKILNKEISIREI